MTKGNNITIRLISAFILVIFVSLGYFIFRTVRKIKQSAKETLPPGYTITSSDSSIISSKYRKYLKVNEVRKSKARNPVVLLSYAENYQLVLHRIRVQGDVSLEEFIETQEKESDVSFGVTYAILNYGAYEFRYKMGPVNPVEKIYLKLSGDSLRQVASSDTKLSYSLLCSNLSIQYGAEKPVDIFVQAKKDVFGNTKRFPLNILFLKRGGDIVFIMCSPRNIKDYLPPDFLFSIVAD